MPGEVLHGQQCKNPLNIPWPIVNMCVNINQ